MQRLAIEIFEKECVGMEIDTGKHSERPRVFFEESAHEWYTATLTPKIPTDRRGIDFSYSKNSYGSGRE